jgi:hypothetical protein
MITTIITKTSDTITTPGKRFNAEGKHIGMGPWINVVWACNEIEDGFFGTPTTATVDGVFYETYAHAEIGFNNDDTNTIRATDPHGREVLAKAIDALGF